MALHRDAASRLGILLYVLVVLLPFICAHLQSDIGMSAVNDALLLQSAFDYLLRHELNEHSSYVALMQALRVVSYESENNPITLALDYRQSD